MSNKIIEDDKNKKLIEFIKKRELDKKGFILMGDRGLGKTFLCKNLVSHEYFIDESEFMQHQKNGMIRLKTPEEFQQSCKFFPLEMLSRVPVVIYDDYGTGIMTESYISNMLYWLNRRIEKGLKTIMTTNLTQEQILERESRIGSRIFELCDIIIVKGEDRRVKNSEKFIIT